MTPDHTIVSTGYNGAPASNPGCLSEGACPRGRASLEDVQPGSSYDTGAGSCIAVHAEQNAIARASWRDMIGATIYITDDSCGGCTRAILGTLISTIVTPHGVTHIER